MAVQRKKTRKLRPVKQNCQFCQTHTLPTYREIDVLKKYITERGKINPRTRTGVCAIHQRKLATAIKHARHVALLPFMVTV